jgi:hypothetical protein
MCDEVAVNQSAEAQTAAATQPQPAAPGRLLTAELIEYKRACDNQLDHFRHVTGGEVMMTEEWAAQHAQEFDFYWCLDMLLSPDAHCAAIEERNVMRKKPERLTDADIAKLFARHWINDPEPVTLPQKETTNTEETNTEPMPAAVGLEG